MDLDGYQEPREISPVRIAANVGAAYAGYKVGGALRRRFNRIDPSVKAFLATIAVVGGAAFLVWVGILGYHGFNATR